MWAKQLQDCWNSIPSCITGIISVPPFVGHTMLTSLCGFAYGMKGFFISSTASLVGSAGAFIMLRCLLSERIHQWSTHNQKWQALEAVIVNPHTIFLSLETLRGLLLLESSRHSSDYPYSSFAVPALGLLEFILCCERALSCSIMNIKYLLIVSRGRVLMAICFRDLFCFP